jgi:hypothetical protein
MGCFTDVPFLPGVFSPFRKIIDMCEPVLSAASARFFARFPRALARSTQSERVDTCQATDHRLFLSFNGWAAPID